MKPLILQLSSIPELNTPTTVSATEVPETKPTEETPQANNEDIKVPETPDTPIQNVDTVEGKPQTRPEYDRFVKMVQVGVPLQAVKLKVSLEGLDPNVLDEILHK